METLKKLLTDLKITLCEANKHLSSVEKSMEDKKTEWSIYQSLKKLGEIDDSNDEPQKERDNEN